MSADERSSAGNTRGLIEAQHCRVVGEARTPSSAGNTRGLIEARVGFYGSHGGPASSAGNTRGLIEAPFRTSTSSRLTTSSAGNTRGLIEAPAAPQSHIQGTRLPRGIPAASLKPVRWSRKQLQRVESSAGNTRGLIEAWSRTIWGSRPRRVFRGEYPRPH